MSARLEQRVPARASMVREAEARSQKLRAPFSLRCGALLIDYTIIVGIIALATLVARMLGGGAYWSGSAVITVGYLAAIAIAALNFIVLAGFSGRTLGKWATGLRIERKNGKPLSFWRAGLRHLLGYTLSLLTLGLGFLLAVFTIEGRALHDRLAGTIVVRDRRDAYGRMR